jgi:catechol 2,3-dioxygenase-like lactoylglutathione lyase family enzyme
MLHHAIDSVWLSCADLEEARRPYERLGLILTSIGPGRAGLFVGQGPACFALHLVSAADPATVPDAVWQTRQGESGLFAVGLRVANVREAVAHLTGRGVRVIQAGSLAWLAVREQAGTDLVLVEGQPPPAPPHRLPLLRLDLSLLGRRSRRQRRRRGADANPDHSATAHR